MNRIPVHSSRIKSVGWLANILEIEFHGGKIYQYMNVSFQEYQLFIRSSSLGQALSVIQKKHPYKPIN